MVVKPDAENLTESWTENWAKSWVDNYEQEIGWENSICAAHDYSESMKNWDDSSIPYCMFWSMNCCLI